MNTYSIKIEGIYLIGITLIILKLFGQIGWSWWIITAPLWIGPALVISAVFMVLLVAAILTVFDAAMVKNNK
jgi:hypothetical protein